MCWKWLAGNTGTKNSPSWHHCKTLSGHIFATKAHMDNRKKLVKQQYLLHMLSQYGELQPTSGLDQSGSLGHPNQFKRVSHLGRVTARHSSIGRQPNFAALNRGRHLYSAGQPSRWTLAHILVNTYKAIQRGHTDICTERPTVCICCSRKQTLWNTVGKFLST